MLTATNKRSTRSLLLLVSAWLLFIVFYAVYRSQHPRTGCSRDACSWWQVNEFIATVSNVFLVVWGWYLLNYKDNNNNNFGVILIALGWASTFHHMHYTCPRMEGRLDVGLLLYFMGQAASLIRVKIRPDILLVLSVFWPEWMKELQLEWSTMYILFGVYFGLYALLYAYGLYIAGWHSSLLTWWQTILLICWGLVTLIPSVLQDTRVIHIDNCWLSSFVHSICGHITLPSIWCIVFLNHIPIQ